MADLHRGSKPSRFLYALRTFSPVQIERDALLCPPNLARKVHLLHAAAERFAPHACHELVKYWKSNDSCKEAEEIWRYWSEIGEWLPIGDQQPSKNTPYGMFYEAYRLEYVESKIGEALELYLQASKDHALAAYSVGRLMGRGKRLEGWKRYNGRQTRAIMSLQCLSIVQQLMGFFIPEDQNKNSSQPPPPLPSKEDLTNARLALELAIGLGNCEAALLASWLAGSTAIPELLRRASLQSIHASVLLRARVEAYNNDVMDNKRRCDGWEIFNAWTRPFEPHETLVEQEGWSSDAVMEAQSLLTTMYSLAADIPTKDEIEVFVMYCFFGLILTNYFQILSLPINVNGVTICFDPLGVSYDHSVCSSTPHPRQLIALPLFIPAAVESTPINISTKNAYENTDDFDGGDVCSFYANVHSPANAALAYVRGAMVDEDPDNSSLAAGSAAINTPQSSSRIPVYSVYRRPLSLERLKLIDAIPRITPFPGTLATPSMPGVPPTERPRLLAMLPTVFPNRALVEDVGDPITRRWWEEICLADYRLSMGFAIPPGLCGVCGKEFTLFQLFYQGKDTSRKCMSCHTTPASVSRTSQAIGVVYFGGVCPAWAVDILTHDLSVKSEWMELSKMCGPVDSTAFLLRVTWLRAQNWFHAVISDTNLELAVTPFLKKPGSWLLRQSSSEIGSFAFTVVEAIDKVVHYRVSRVGEDYVLRLRRGVEKKYATMSAMLEGAEKELGLREAIPYATNRVRNVQGVRAALEYLRCGQ